MNAVDSLKVSLLTNHKSLHFLLPQSSMFTPVADLHYITSDPSTCIKTHYGYPWVYHSILTHNLALVSNGDYIKV